MLGNQPTRLRAAIALSLAVSVSLVLVPLVFPNVLIGPFILANWGLMMIVGWLTLPRFNWRQPFQKPDRDKGRLFAVVLVVFTVAGYLAIYNARSMVQADDLAELRKEVFMQSD